MNEVNVQRVNRDRLTAVLLPGFTVTGQPGLQRPDRATATATGPMKLPGQRGNSRPKAYQN